MCTTFQFKNLKPCKSTHIQEFQLILEKSFREFYKKKVWIAHTLYFERVEDLIVFKEAQRDLKNNGKKFFWLKLDFECCAPSVFSSFIPCVYFIVILLIFKKYRNTWIKNMANYYFSKLKKYLSSQIINTWQS